MIYIAFLLFIFCILALSFYQWQFYMVFTPTYKREGSLCAKCSLLSMTTDDGVELEGAIYEPLNANNTLLFFAGRSHDGVGIINKLADTYVNTRVIIFNYRSYGKSTGSVNEKNIYGDGVKIAQLVEKNYGSFYMLGYSLGSSVAAFVASHHKVKGVFLIGAFDSIASLAKSKFVDRGKFPYINLANVFRYKFRTGEHMQKVDSPTYLFVSKHDEVTYIQNARELKEKVKNLTYYEELENLSHKEILWNERVTKKINEVIC
ncbi:alpha/beta fold hydrolase [Sulfurimonas sp. SAG-AH-194-C20]|nr:alpha/beta fold hydrolase [Sulfurimonas sp. SAG-AH-194-C20]MDF1879129.1 alpha/beta fold hydrolase [Sulfurimonas sp. SAG-AH-194-C20]